MTAELIAQSSQELAGESVGIAGLESGDQRHRDDRGRNVEIDGLGQSPSSLALIFHY